MASRVLLVVLMALFWPRALHAGEGPILVELDPTAAALPEGEIREAIQKELGRPAAAPTPGSPGDVQIAVADGRIVVRVVAGTTVLERSVPLPANLSDVPLTVSLVVGNLARDQSREFEKPPATPAPEPQVKSEAIPPKAKTVTPVAKPLATPRPQPRAESVPASPPAFRSHWFGLHVAQDIAFVGGNNICDPNLGQKSENYACFYQGTTDQPFVHTPYPYRDGIQPGIVFATQRVLASYDAALSPWLSLGGRFGFALGGGPPAGQAVTLNGSTPPDRAVGSGGTPFMPVHVELGARGWFLPLTERAVRAYAKASFGVAQVDAKVEIPEYDCTHAGLRTIDPAFTDEQSMPFDHDMDPNTPPLTPTEQCQLGKGNYDNKLHQPVLVDAWKKMGQAFVSLGAGGMVALTDRLGVVLDVNVMLMLPAPGVVLEPSIGLEYGL